MVFLHFLLKFKPFDDFSLPKRDANRSLCVARVCLCVCVHTLNKDVSQAIIGTFLFFLVPSRFLFTLC